MIEFAKEDIELRVESMKFELDKLGQSLIKELTCCKAELIK
jgi:hypothetical protein